MKKIFTLIAAAFVGVACASAAQALDYSRFHVEGLNPRYASMLANPAAAFEGRNFENAVKEGRVMHRTMEKGNYVYNVTIMNQGILTDFWAITDKDNNKMNFGDLPFYVVTVNITRAPKDTPDNPNVQILCYTSWPSESFMASEDIIGDLGLGVDPKGFDPDLKDIISIDDIANGQAYSNTFLWRNLYQGGTPNATKDNYALDNLLPGVYENNTVGYWPIWSPMANAASNWNGAEVQMTSDEGANKVSGFQIAAYTSSDSNLDMNCEFYFDNGENFIDEYKGECVTHNMVIRNFDWTPKTVNIFNGGITEQGGNNDEGNLMFPYAFGYAGDAMDQSKNVFSPVQEFFMTAMVGTGLEFGINSSSETVPYDPSLIVPMRPTDDYTPVTDDYNWIQGAFWTPDNVFQNHTIFLMPAQQGFVERYGQKIPVMCSSPEANGALEYGWNYEWSEKLGLQGAGDGWTLIMRDPTRFAFGTPDGFNLVGTDNAGNTYNVSNVEEVIYHNNPEDMRVSEVVKVKGDYEMEEVNGVDFIVEENGARVFAANGAINVVAADAVEVAVFNLNGAAVAKANVAAGATASFQVEKGVYLVKVGKNAKKVVL